MSLSDSDSYENMNTHIFVYYVCLRVRDFVCEYLSV